MSGPRLSLTGIKKETHVIYFGNSVVNYFIHYNDKLLEEGTIKSVSQKLFNIISGANFKLLVHIVPALLCTKKTLRHQVGPPNSRQPPVCSNLALH